ncbi:MAG: radical SAM protein, partial [Elusimicrobiota bacterium]|nr:radical SAM protein [Elusimicrobiota bacterium]
MDIFRYLHFFKQSQFGFNLPKCSIVNYLKFHYGLIDDKIGECGKIYPVLCTIEVTKRCNLQCPFCIFGKFPSNWQENELTPSKFEKILNLDLIKKTLIFVFSGGEPLLNKDLPKLVYMARKRKHLVGMISNGILLNEEIAKSLAKVGGKDSIAGISDIQISIYENTKDKLSYILPKVSQYMPINPSFVLLKSKLLESSKNNFVDLIDMIIMAKESGCKSFKFNICAADIIKNDFSETISKQDDIIYSQFIEACKTKLKGIVFKGYKSDYSFLSKKFSLFFPKWHDESDGRKC